MSQDVEMDMILLNGKVITMAPGDRIEEAVAVKDGRISKVGITAEISKTATERTKVIDVGGKTILPGFVDSHTHLEATAVHLAHMVRIHSPPVKSVAEMMNLMKERAQITPEGDWVIGRGCFFQQHKLAEGRLPTKGELDKAVPNHPALTIHGAHLGILNSIGLKTLGVTKDTDDLGRGTLLERDPATGEPTGMVIEVSKVMPFTPRSRDELKEDMIRTIREMFIKQGVTSVHEIPASTLGVSVYQELLEEGQLPLRVTLYPVVPKQVEMDWLLRMGFRSGFGNDWLKLGGVKMFVDGGITAPAAALHDPYPNRPGYYGLLQLSQEELTEKVTNAHAAGLQVWLHTAGEKAQDMSLNAFEQALSATFREDHRHRLEHAANAFCTPERIARYRELGVLPAANSQFIHAFGFVLAKYYGDKAKVVFPYKTLLQAGLKVPNGSDSTGTQPEGTNPFWGIWCCVARRSFDDSLVCPEESISPMEALRMYTINAAYGANEDKDKGSIEPGKLADMVVVSEDILTVPTDRIKDIKVEKTIVGGEEVYSREV